MRAVLLKAFDSPTVSIAFTWLPSMIGSARWPGSGTSRLVRPLWLVPAQDGSCVETIDVYCVCGTCRICTAGTIRP